MKLIITFIALACSMAILSEEKLAGAWQSTSGDVTTIVLIEQGYFTKTTFTPHRFISTEGGVISTDEKNLIIQQEFNTSAKELQKITMPYSLQDKQLTLGGRPFKRIDEGDAPLAGVWKITGRMQDGKLTQIHQRGTRKTLKMLTGTRFQWFAIDPDGNQFFGTGGGTYTFQDGKYTENIDFFSRDNSRVGASLSFDGRLEDGAWHHSGLSSKGDKIYEVWQKDL